METVLITGGTGSLGKELISQMNGKFNIIQPNSNEMNVIDIETIEHFILLNKPKYLIHCAAITKNIDKDIINVININIIGTANIVKICKKYNIKLIYISTDYVYPVGSKFIKEFDGLQPVNNYAWSKLGGECSVKMYNNSLILRLSFMTKPFPYNIAASNIIRNIQYIDKVCETILSVLDEFGVLNIGDSEVKSMYQLGLETNFNIKPNIIDDKIAQEKSIILDITKLNNIKNK